MFCPKCGNEIEENAKFCAKCGYQVTQFNEDNNNADVPVHKSDVPVHEEKKGKKGKVVPITIVLAIILLFVVIGIGLMSGGDSDLEAVKRSYPEAYKEMDLDFDEAFNNFYDSVEWKNMDEGEKNPSIVAICKISDGTDEEVNKWYFNVISKTGDVKFTGCNANGSLMSDFEAQLTLKMIFDPRNVCDYNPVNDPAFADEFTDETEVSEDVLMEDTGVEMEQTDTADGEAGEQTSTTGTIQPLNSSGYDYNDLQYYWDFLRELQATYGVVQWYSVYDMDADNVPELFVSYGEIYNQTGEVYTIDDEEVGGVKYLGSFNGENTSLYVEEDGTVVAVYGYMGTEVLTYFYKNKAGLTISEQPYRELGPDEDYYQTPYPIEYIYIGDGAE